ncbi:hypothetical protein DPMN_150895 [Dreissena polymorpha]|uniref:Uncharacterized protein n=1 Tax=Dreissena polymorpha TaxID=45954 RepID=A0A9D4J6S2_DREPO|nr:hypothetical protein DPMN_150895 [Dreissena polymorpha]
MQPSFTRACREQVCTRTSTRFWPRATAVQTGKRCMDTTCTSTSVPRTVGILVASVTERSMCPVRRNRTTMDSRRASNIV